MELVVGGLEAFRADEDSVGLGKAVGFALGVKEFVDGRFPALIPDFFKPTFGEILCSLLLTWASSVAGKISMLETDEHLTFFPGSIPCVELSRDRR